MADAILGEQGWMHPPQTRGTPSGLRALIKDFARDEPRDMELMPMRPESAQAFRMLLPARAAGRSLRDDVRMIWVRCPSPLRTEEMLRRPMAQLSSSAQMSVIRIGGFFA